jgi:hypothetical protein
MSESTLQITWTEIETEIGRFLGYDRTVGNWSANQVADALAIAKRGIRQFYFPQRTRAQELAGEKAHRWSFLRPHDTLDIWDDVIADDAITVSTAVYADPVTTVTASASVFYPSMEEKTMAFDENSNTYVIDEYVSSTVVKVTGDASGEAGNTITIDSEDLFTLPWDYGGMSGEGRFTYDVSENKLSSIDVTSDARIRLFRQSSVATGTPYLAAIIPLTTAGTQGQRWGVIFHPPPNDVITLHYRYYVLADALVDTSLEYPYGSVAHSETILESCLAIAETRENDSASTEHQARFAVLLQSSIDHDKQLGQTVTNYGYNRDNSDGPDEGREQLARHYSLVSYEGVEY